MRGALALIALLVACDTTPGAVHLLAPGVEGELVIDQVHRGPVLAEQTIELPPGEHRIAIWSGPSELVASVVEVRSRMVVELAVDPSQLPGAAAEREAAERAEAARAEAQRVAEEAARTAAQEEAAQEAADRQASLAAIDEAARDPAIAAALAEQPTSEHGARGLLPAILAHVGEATRTCRPEARMASRLELTVHVTREGRVDLAEVSGAPEGPLTRCVVREARRWRFPPTGDDAQISMPLSFSP